MNTKRAEGGYGMTMTCASHVHALGQGFEGQLGCFHDGHVEGLGLLASAIREAGSLSSVQLHHAGMRSPAQIIRERPLCPSENLRSGARALSIDEVRDLVEAFVRAAERADEAGFTDPERGRVVVTVDLDGDGRHDRGLVLSLAFSDIHAYKAFL